MGDMGRGKGWLSRGVGIKWDRGRVERGAKSGKVISCKIFNRDIVVLVPHGAPPLHPPSHFTSNYIHSPLPPSLTFSDLFVLGKKMTLLLVN